MVDAESPQLVTALVLAVSALFVSVNLVKSRYRATMRRISIVAFLLALGVVLIRVGAWLAAQF